MSLEGNDTINQEANSNVAAESTPHEEGDMNSEILAAFEGAEEGMTQIPRIVEVEDTETLSKLVGMSPSALEQYRVDNSGE